MENRLKKIAEQIISQEKLSDCNELNYNAFSCKTKDDKSVVLKIGERVTSRETKKLQSVLQKLQKLDFKNIIIPEFISMSKKDDSEQYIITSFIEAESPPWSEDNGNSNWGGKNINLDYLPFVIRAIEDLENVEYTQLNLTNDREQVDIAIDTLNQLKDKQLITDDKVDEISRILNKGAKKYYKEQLMLSNGDFYPRNVLEGENNKTVIIDWDGARFTVREHTFMYFWCSMFGNTAFQNKLLNYFMERNDFDKDRFIFGLLMAALEDIRLWLKHKNCSQALVKYISYLESYKTIIKK